MKTPLIFSLLIFCSMGNFIHLGFVACYVAIACIVSGKNLKYSWPWWLIMLVAFELLYLGIKTIFL